ncbi:uncharacterized protein BYT42DRAFT_559927 [Radiomyces spectabilis]|uniref:uncharacterized protein n=1 Tax=Radiomyces spectabilis TaxID=64574 RepID=UPI00221EE8F8|nr:uncharacterized protein BYT42DRAFT_559927 [Radiomyces spectabilis]KAI8388394.1 hypothetical protein BYT42DRAFT_559927 [Radiomyces spectabilis]
MVMSLQDQLKRLGTADLRNTTEVSRRYKASFLFTAKEAADKDLETIYAIGYNGILELCNLDERFTAFQETLFSEGMKSVDRVLQTKEDNEKLDASVTAFLRQLSPYFLVKPAGKALEWLIRRFRIHQFNVEAIVGAILPYHETKAFVKMVSILQIDDASPWGFLKSIKESGVPLPRSVLVTKLHKDRFVLDFVCKTVTENPVHFSTLYAFFAATMTSYITAGERITEDKAVALMPYLINGLNARKIPELQIAAYMIVSQLSSVITLSTAAISSFTRPMLKRCGEKHLGFGLLAVVHLAQTQASFEGLGKSTTAALMRSPSFEQHLLDIAGKYTTERFMACMIPSFCAAGKVELLQKLVLNSYLSSENVRLLCNRLVDNYLSVPADGKKDYVATHRPLLMAISQLCVDDLDAVLEKRVQKVSSTESPDLYEFISAAFKGTRHDVVREANTTLYLCLNSPAASVRLLGIKKLVTILDDKESALTQSPDMIRSLFVGALESFDDLLLYMIRDVPQKLLEFVPAQDVFNALNRLMQERGAYANKSAHIVVQFLYDQLALNHPEMATRVARLLAVFAFAASDDNIKAFKPTSVKKQGHLLKTMYEHYQTSVKSSGAMSFIKLEADGIQTEVSKERLDFWIDMVKSDNRVEKVLGLLVISRAIYITKDTKQYGLGLAALEGVFASVDAEGKKAIYTTKYLASMGSTEEGLPLSTMFNRLLKIDDLDDLTIARLIQLVIRNIAVAMQPLNEEIVWSAAESQSQKVRLYGQTMVALFKALVGGPTLGCFESMLPTFIRDHLQNKPWEFLVLVWSSEDVSYVIQARALQIAASLMTHNGLQSNAVDFQHLVPALLPLLQSEESSLRVQTIHCLQAIQKAYAAVGLPTGRKFYEKDNDKKSSAGKPSGNITILSSSSLYGPSGADIGHIRSDDAAHFVDYLCYRSTELSGDRMYIASLLKEYLQLCEQSKDKSARVRKDTILGLFLDHVKALPYRSVQINLLNLLQDIEAPLKLQKLAPVLQAELKKPRDTVHARFVGLLIRCYLPCNASQLGAKNDTTLPLFLELLSNKTETEQTLDVCLYALQQITPAFFAEANENTQQKLFANLIRIATDGQQKDIRAAKSVLSRISVPVKMLVENLTLVAKTLMGSVTVDSSTQSAKRARVATTASKPVDLYQLVTVLEYVETTSIMDDVALIKPLFEVLTAVINADLRDSPVSLDYINQITMASLTRIIQSAEEKKINVEESTLRVDVVVQCIRVTGNPQTHNQALLLMATIASMYPECVLHNIMPVFTFMGANVLRQDDNYSFQVIQQTLEKVIPPLVASRRLTTDGHAALALQVKPVIKVFVDALFHIPKHRRLRLFSVLIHTLGEDEFLYVIISLLLEKFTEKLARGAKQEAESLTEFSLVISQQFTCQTQMKALIALLNSMLTLPNEKPDDVEMSQDTLFNVNEHSAKQLRQYKLATVNFVGELLGSRGFLSKARSVNAEDAREALEPFYLESVELLLKIVTYFSDFAEQYAASAEKNPAVVKFWRAILKVVYDVLTKVNALLSLPAFINVVTHLLKHREVSIRRKAMTLFNEKIEALRGQAPEEGELHLVNMVKELCDCIAMESKTTSEEDSSINKQSALLCIASLAKISGQRYPGEFADAIPVITGAHGLQVDNDQLKISSLVCLTVICQEIGPRAVPHLPKFMPIMIDLLSKTVSQESSNVMLEIAVIAALETIVSVLPHFVSPYLGKILGGILHSSIYEVDVSLDAQRQAVKEKADAVLSAVATKVPPRVLLTPVFAFYDSALKRGKNCVLSLYSVVSQAIRTMSRDVMTSHYKQLFKFFLLAFDIRRTHGKQFDADAINELEGSIINAFLDLVMKLNETLFKPLFLKIYDWATLELGDDRFSKAALERALFFYKLLDGLLAKLKSIFTPYFGYVIDDVIARLEQYKSTETTPDTLWCYLMQALQKSFLYDADNLWNAEKFEKILDPVIEQMSIIGTNESEAYLTRMTTYLVPCIGQMAVTISNDTLWKPLNHKILMKTREDIPEIRLAALKCIEELYSRLGEEWLLFLAESISFLAELMEDDDPRVEKLVQQVNAQIETHFGESLDKFFQ